MRAGVDVVYQAMFADDWLGHVDFLRKVDVPSALGPWSYEPLDTKLAHRVKPHFVVQPGPLQRAARPRSEARADAHGSCARHW